jgi:hypothetical protein|tara:strand:- start:3878 stop:4066 length:189 start_codon:yes stop_codon:yes gene_type:complete
MCRAEWFPAPNAGRMDMLRLLDRVLNGLAALEIRDSQTRREVDDVERSLHRIRDMLYGNRWV